MMATFYRLSLISSWVPPRKRLTNGRQNHSQPDATHEVSVDAEKQYTSISREDTYMPLRQGHADGKRSSFPDHKGNDWCHHGGQEDRVAFRFFENNYCARLQQRGDNDDSDRWTCLLFWFFVLPDGISQERTAGDGCWTTKCRVARSAPCCTLRASDTTASSKSRK